VTPGDRAGHWDAAYVHGDAGVSWRQAHPGPSLRAIAVADPPPALPLIDIGGGSSALAGALLAAGHTDITVLDVSARALRLARERLGAHGDAIEWIAADLLDWVPARRYALWHDRALLHFLTRAADRAAYAAKLRAALAPGGCAVIAGFAPGGPATCSGLPVERSSPGAVLALLGDEFDPVLEATEEHVTPGGRTQPFAWLVARRRG
jgi:SAM-dependent methyltransferase